MSQHNQDRLVYMIVHMLASTWVSKYAFTQRIVCFDISLYLSVSFHTEPQCNLNTCGQQLGLARQQQKVQDSQTFDLICSPKKVRNHRSSQKQMPWNATSEMEASKNLTKTHKKSQLPLRTVAVKRWAACLSVNGNSDTIPYRQAKRETLAEPHPQTTCINSNKMKLYRWQTLPGHNSPYSLNL